MAVGVFFCAVWIDVKKVYHSVDHGWSNGVMLFTTGFRPGIVGSSLSFVGVGTRG